MSHQCEQSNKSAVSDYKLLLIVSSQPYPTLPYTTPNPTLPYTTPNPTLPLYYSQPYPTLYTTPNPTKRAPYLVQSYT